jgi:hypothetical protein
MSMLVRFMPLRSTCVLPAGLLISIFFVRDTVAHVAHEQATHGDQSRTQLRLGAALAQASVHDPVLLERHGFERIETGQLVETYARSTFEDTRRKAQKYGARGTTLKAYKSNA